MMNRWKEWRRRLKRAEKWDDADLEDTNDADIRALQKMFRAARRDSPNDGDRIWRKIRPSLHALGGHAPGGAPPGPANLWAVLAAAGPRFALGALCAFLIMAGAFWSQSPAPPPLETAALRAPAEFRESQAGPQAGPPEEYPVEALQSSNGDELLRYIAYTSPGR
jgi:hypothetical protein